MCQGAVQAFPEHQLLMISAGPLDLLGEIGGNLGYDQLLTDSTERVITPNLTVRLLNLDRLIALKESLARDKDKAVLAILKRSLGEQRKN